MKVAFFEVEKWQEEYLKNNLAGQDVVFFAQHLSKENSQMAKDCEIISIFIDSKIDEDLLAQLPNLKMIATMSTGFDHIDLAECKKRNIVVCNVPFYGENTVAEHTFGLILDLSRKIHQSIEMVKREGFLPKGLMGFDLKGKTIGIIGLGHIGQHVARIASGFEMHMLAFDVNQDKKLAKKLGFKYVALEDLLKNSDIITLHAPYNEHTHHMINSSNINLVKRGSYLINTARGGLIETAALVKAIDDGILAGAGLDVLEEERFVKDEKELLFKDFSAKCDIKTLLQDHVLMERENVIITPHNAFNSKEGLERILDTTVENIQAFQKNKPINLVSSL